MNSSILPYFDNYVNKEKKLDDYFKKGFLTESEYNRLKGEGLASLVKNYQAEMADNAISSGETR